MPDLAVSFLCTKNMELVQRGQSAGCKEGSKNITRVEINPAGGLGVKWELSIFQRSSNII